jgi:3-hydroxyethyl bacteriochlorophyllide a dehydrogenase
VLGLLSSGRLDLAGLITHTRRFDEAVDAYPVAFTDPTCLKMLLDWRSCS